MQRAAKAADQFRSGTAPLDALKSRLADGREDPHTDNPAAHSNTVDLTQEPPPPTASAAQDKNEEAKAGETKPPSEDQATGNTVTSGSRKLLMIMT